MDEVQRIKEVYGKRVEKNRGAYFHLFSSQREKEIKEVLRKEAITSLSKKKVLDVGCGHGAVLSCFLKEGAPQKNLYGIDLVPERIAKARRLYSGISFTYGNAERLPYPDQFFDIVTQSTVFTSILDSGMKKGMAAEMLRVLKLDGIIIWHDFRFDNPFNRNVKGIGKREIIGLFSGCQFNFKLMNLNPVVAKPLTEISLRWCEILEKFPILLTHWLVSIKRSNLKPEKTNE
ncbi:MAG: class I SAM-dependent methyltransferase [Deltaproteobacteria bacterium]|nr:class I SAM-dependent methyltransferase [Deltaproteobacteria bacterium]